MEKLKDTSSPGPEGITAKLAKLLYRRLPKIFNLMHIQYYHGIMRHFNERNLKDIEKPGKSSYLIRVTSSY